MHTGMLWFDNSNKSLSQKIEGAMIFYREKYGTNPNMCFVHPSAGEATVDGLEVRPYRPVLPGHIWIGMKDA